MDRLEGGVRDQFRVPIATAAILAKDNGLDGVRLIQFRTGAVELTSGIVSAFLATQRNLKGEFLISRSRTEAKVLLVGLYFCWARFFSELFSAKT